MRSLDEIAKDMLRNLKEPINDESKWERAKLYAEVREQTTSNTGVLEWVKKIDPTKADSQTTINSALKLVPTFTKDEVLTMGQPVAVELANKRLKEEFPEEWQVLYDLAITGKYSRDVIRKTISGLLKGEGFHLPKSLKKCKTTNANANAETLQNENESRIQLVMDNSKTANAGIFPANMGNELSNEPDYKKLYEEAMVELTHYKTLEAIKNSTYIGDMGFFSSNPVYMKEQCDRLEDDLQYCALLLGYTKPYAELTATEIKTGYRKLANQYHPDKGGTTEHMVAIQNALSFLNLMKSMEQQHQEKQKKGRQI